jgi:hypothetical protein
MEACYAEGSKSRGDAVPQISLRPLAHQNCIQRDRIVAVAPSNGDSGQSFGLEFSSSKLRQQPLCFLLHNRRPTIDFGTCHLRSSSWPSVKVPSSNPLRAARISAQINVVPLR